MLLSPACASFDQFADFEARGEAFCELVEGHAGLAAGRRSQPGCQQPQHGAPVPPARRDRTASVRGAKRSRRARQPLEQRILLTATLCLLAFGAVMVYSASSATSLLQGHGNGSGYLVKYLDLRRDRPRADARARARRRRESAGDHRAAAGHVVRARARRAHPARRRERQRRAPLARRRAAAVPAVGADEARARAVRARRCWPSARSACTTCASWPSRCWSSSARAILLVATQPDLGTAMVIAFTTIALLVAAGIDDAQAGDRRRLRVRRRRALRAGQTVRAGAPDLVPGPVGARLQQRLSGGAGPDRDRLGRAVRRRAGRSRCRRSSTCPRRRPTSSSR